MQTYTHGLAGLVVAQMALTGGLILTGVPWWVALVIAWAIGFAGAVAPDVVMIPEYLMDWMAGRQPMTEEGPFTRVVKEISHSIPVWTILGVLAWICIPHGTLRDMVLLFFVAGLVGGVITDIPSHSEEQYKKTDCGFLWPFPQRLRWPNTKWEYRYGHGILWPMKSWERNLNVFLLILLLVLVTLQPV